MDAFEYTVILISIILGLGISQILMGIGDLVIHRGEIKLAPQHSTLVLLVFFFHIQEWWAGYNYMMTVPAWTLPRVLNWLVYPVILFIFARILFPIKIDEETDLDHFYWKQWRTYFVMLLLTAIVSSVQNMTLENIPITGQVPQISLAVITLIILISKTKSRMIHLSFFLIQVIAWIAYILVNNRIII